MEKKYSEVFIENEIHTLKSAWLTVKRAFREFLSLPTIILVVFLLLALFSNILDHNHQEWLKPLRSFMKKTIFHNGKATSDLLSTIASSIITVLSLTITLLLIVVQQTASSMTTQVFDQFLRAKHNQIYFGFFVGLSFYSLIVLASVNDSFNPVIGASIAFFLCVIGIYILLILVYTTINEMRPAVIIGAIYDHVITAREKQLLFIRKTRSTPGLDGPCHVSIKIKGHGYITDINEVPINEAIGKLSSPVEVVLSVSLGDYVSYEDQIGYVTCTTIEDGEKIGHVVGAAIEIDIQRNIDIDPANGVKQLKMIAWTSISTAKQSQSPGLFIVRILRDLLLRWTDSDLEKDKKTYPIVYQDTVMDQLMGTFETLIVVTTESMQHENFLEIMRTFTIAYDRISPRNQVRTDDIIMRSLSGMGDLVLTAPLEDQLNKLIQVLKNAGSMETAHAVELATSKIKQSVGKLNSRSTRIK